MARPRSLVHTLEARAWSTPFAVMTVRSEHCPDTGAVASTETVVGSTMSERIPLLAMNG